MTGPSLLARTAELGSYFAMPQLSDDDGEDLAALLLDEAAVRDFTDRTRSAIAASMNVDPSGIPPRVAASTFHLNVVARLMSPVIGGAALCGDVPVFTPASVRWRGSSSGHTPQFGVTDLHWAPFSSPAIAAEIIAGSVLASIVGPFNETLAASLSLSTHVTWGNAISAANGAVTVMAMSRPDLEQPGRALVRALLDTGALHATGSFAEGRFVRRSCCLFYQAPGGGLCQDCVLAAAR